MKTIILAILTLSGVCFSGCSSTPAYSDIMQQAQSAMLTQAQVEELVSKAVSSGQITQGQADAILKAAKYITK